MNAIAISHKTGSYEVRFDSLDQALNDLPSDIRIITDENVFGHYRHLLDRFMFVKAIPAGEQSKSISGLTSLLSWLADSRASRKTPICAFGGGVVGDLGGFTAAVYMRGVPFIQIPTTLLSQVDSSVGGKVGIDLPEGKNLAGAFYAPQRVHIPIDALESLPQRQFTNGMAEVWKYGFIMDKPLAEALSNELLTSGSQQLGSVVQRCIGLKAKVVQEDEFETLGLRAILNFGHTVGHAIEFLTGYGPILHGEAISIGMVVEARIGEMLGVTPKGISETVKDCFIRQGLPVTHSILKDSNSLIHSMYGDKKAVNGQLALSLLTDIGGCRLVEAVDESVIRAALEES